jgi:hypothetical protein
MMSTPKGSIPTAGSTAGAPADTAPRASGDGNKWRESWTAEQEIVPPRPEQAAPDAAIRLQKTKATRRSRPRRIPGSADALLMLTKCPVVATPIPRHHVERRGPDGSRIILDRATSEQFVVYSPRLVPEFRAGHHAGLWYLRRASEPGATPSSAGYPSARAAVQALLAGQWRAVRSPSRSAGKRIRVIWS